MSALGNDFTDCTVLIYDINGNHLSSTIIKEHDRETKQVYVNIIPDKLKVNDNYYH